MRGNWSLTKVIKIKIKRVLHSRVYIKKHDFEMHSFSKLNTNELK